VRCARASDYTANSFSISNCYRYSQFIAHAALTPNPFTSFLHFPPLSSLRFQSEQIKCAIINQQTLGKKTLQFVLTWRFAAETNMPLITVSISISVAVSVSVSVWLRVSRFVVKNASQDMALCALCTLCNLQLATGNLQPNLCAIIFYCRPLFLPWLATVTVCLWIAFLYTITLFIV